MQKLATLCEAVSATTRKTEKVALVADYLRARSLPEAEASAVFLSGRVFAAHQETTLQLGGRALWRLIAELSGRSEATLARAYRRHGDLGAAAYDVLIATAPQRSSVSVVELAAVLVAVSAARGPAAKAQLLRPLLRRLTALQIKYAVKIISGDLRIGLRESLVEEAIAKAFDAPVAQVQRANMLLGDIGETLRLAAGGRLHEARMRLFHPVGFMLASPVESASEALDGIAQAAVEDKYDGIRAQAHVSGGGVRLFSRTLDDVTGAFPELADALAAFPDELILDGEIVAWQALAENHGQTGRALPFAELQKRLGRKRVTEEMMRRVPVAYIVFDVLYAGGDLLMDRPLRQRGRVLDGIFEEASQRAQIRGPAAHRRFSQIEDVQGRLQFEPAVPAPAGGPELFPQAPPSQVLRAPVLVADSAEQLEVWFEMALSRGNEGLMVKSLSSLYTPGRRGRAWLKLKRELATLDVVVTSVEWGHGKRARVLSDYTFAVRDGARLVNVGKAYSGLTDKEIAELTQWFLAHTVRDHGFMRDVEPRIVLEVAFNAVMRSGRHESGYALRFPRILRLRPDKPVDEIDTLERVQEIHDRQKWPQTA